MSVCVCLCFLSLRPGKPCLPASVGTGPAEGCDGQLRAVFPPKGQGSESQPQVWPPRQCLNILAPGDLPFQGLLREPHRVSVRVQPPGSWLGQESCPQEAEGGAPGAQGAGGILGSSLFSHRRESLTQDSPALGPGHHRPPSGSRSSLKRGWLIGGGRSLDSGLWARAPCGAEERPCGPVSAQLEALGAPCRAQEAPSPQDLGEQGGAGTG